jgi:selenocysteine-specific elongation factor
VHVIATAGHVDHGKSTLVRRLTGVDPDRLAEEKARGLTIDLGFAACTLPSGAEFGFVDVPGHARFIKNMLAGVGGIDGCLFVVAATEGWKPQSAEHLAILELLGIGHGVIALTKVAKVSPDDLATVLSAVRARVAGTFLSAAEVVPVDAPAGIGVEGADGILGALDRMIAATPLARDQSRPRLWVDRSFIVQGSGVVVTGILTGGAVTFGQQLVVLPGGHRVRVRGLQSHGQSLKDAGPGRRLAVNLSGVSQGQVSRGDVVVQPEQWHRTSTVDATLHVLSGLDHEVSRRGAFVAYVGSGEYPVRLRTVGGRQSIEPGETGAVRLWLPVPLPLAPGDHYILRESGRAETVGGGQILDVDPVLPIAKASPDRSTDRVITERGWTEVDELERLTGQIRPANAGRWVVGDAALAECHATIHQLVDQSGSLGLPVAALDMRQRAVLAGMADLVIRDGFVLPANSVAGLDAALEVHPFLAALEAAPFSPPPPDGVARGELRALERRGLVIESNGIWFARTAADKAEQVVAGLLIESPQGVLAGKIRAALSTTRRYALPLLAYLDANGITRRRGDLRIAGPRLSAAPEGNEQNAVIQSPAQASGAPQ